MQIALIMSNDEPPAEEARVRGGTIAEPSVLDHQLRFALSAGCEQIICIAEHLPPDLDRLRTACSQTGARFRLLHRPRELSSVVAAHSRLLVIAKNVLIDPAMRVHLEQTRCHILTVPADVGVPRGFERIDATRAWAGMMVVPGCLVERLYDLPEDIDPASALLRIALIDRTTLLDLSDTAIARRIVTVADRAPPAQFSSPERRANSIRSSSFSAPLRSFVEQLAVRHNRWLLPRTQSLVVWAATSLLLTVAAATWGWIWLALLTAFVANALLIVWRTLQDVAGEQQKHGSTASAAAADLGIVYVVGMADPSLGSNVAAWFAPLMLIGLLRVTCYSSRGVVAAPAGDRLALILLLALGHAAGFLLQFVMLISLLLMALFVIETGRKKITTN